MPRSGKPRADHWYPADQHPVRCRRVRASECCQALVRFMMGGADGDVSGYKYFNTLGGWPVRDDIEPAEGSTPYSELHVSDFNVTDIYENINPVRDFWTLLG